MEAGGGALRLGQRPVLPTWRRAVVLRGRRGAGHVSAVTRVWWRRLKWEGQVDGDGERRRSVRVFGGDGPGRGGQSSSVGGRRGAKVTQTARERERECNYVQKICHLMTSWRPNLSLSLSRNRNFQLCREETSWAEERLGSRANGRETWFIWWRVRSSVPRSRRLLQLRSLQVVCL